MYVCMYGWKEGGREEERREGGRGGKKEGERREGGREEES